MKIFLPTLLFVLFSNLIFGQSFKLIEPNISKLKEQISSGQNTKVIHHYLNNNYKLTSEKYDLEYYEWDKSMLCAFTQKFENEIKYSVFECKEAGGITLELELPKMERKELMKWIEKIYEVDKMDIDQNIWKEDNSKFEPTEANPGCYFKIEERARTTFVELYCGC